MHMPHNNHNHNQPVTQHKETIHISTYISITSNPPDFGLRHNYIKHNLLSTPRDVLNIHLASHTGFPFRVRFIVFIFGVVDFSPMTRRRLVSRLELIITLTHSVLEGFSISKYHRRNSPSQRHISSRRDSPSQRHISHLAYLRDSPSQSTVGGILLLNDAFLI